MVLKPSTWLERLRDRFGLFLYRHTGVRSGPYMYQTWGGQWMLVDASGALWQLTYQHPQGWGESPIRITKVLEP